MSVTVSILHVFVLLWIRGYFLKHSLGGTNDLRSERLGMGPREYHHRDQRRPGRLGGVGLKFYPWRISRDLGG